jgi:hypothetical protein
VLVAVTVFSWGEKLVAPLIAAPNVDRAIEDKMIGKKATLHATHVIHACRKESLFFFANKLDKVLVWITLVVLSGFKIMGKIEMAGAMFPPIFVLKLPVAKAKVPKQKSPREWRVGLKIFGWTL